MKFLSIVIPIFNVEGYIRRCLNSLLNQDIPNTDLEIICINDGSTDNSAEIVKSIQSNCNNVFLINQPNHGVSNARNNGINMSQGQYILFVDPDDYLESNAIKEKIELLKKYEPDVAYCSHTLLDENLNEVYKFEPKVDSNKVYTGIDFVNSFIRGHSEVRAPHSSVGIFYKKEFFDLHNIRFLEGVPYLEDGHLLAKITCLADRVYFFNKPFYFITRRPGSANTSDIYHTKKASFGFLKAAYDLYDFKLNYCTSIEHKLYMNQPIVQFVIVYLISNERSRSYTELYNALKRGCLRKVDSQFCTPFYRNMAKAYNLSIRCFYIYWLLFKLFKSVKTRISKFPYFIW